MPFFGRYLRENAVFAPQVFVKNRSLQRLKEERIRRMNHRIAAGVIVEHNERILLVRHCKPEAYDFWVAPGGGAEGDEDLRTAAKREVLEECGLNIEPQAIAYIEEFTNPNVRECKVWFTGKLLGGTLDVSRPEATREHIIEAAWLSRSEFEGKTIFPPMLANDYWVDKNNGFAYPRYVGVRKMAFY
jgi:8-oxo-dGTP diphosphatase